MSNVLKKILEYTWLLIALLSLGAGIHKTYKIGFGSSYPFFIMTFIAILMYMFRRNMRIAQKQKE
jgi:hypothetical protein